MLTSRGAIQMANKKQAAKSAKLHDAGLQSAPLDALMDHRRQAFKVELELNDDRSVHHTHVIHLPAGKEQKHPGWDERWVSSFIAAQAQLNLPDPATLQPAPELNPTIAAANSDEARPVPAAITHTASPMASELGIISKGSNAQPGRSFWVLGKDEAYSVRLMLNLIDPAAVQDIFNYEAEIWATQLASGFRQRIYATRGKIDAGGTTLRAKGAPLASGMHRIEAVVVLRSANPDNQDAPLAAVTERVFVHVT